VLVCLDLPSRINIFINFEAAHRAPILLLEPLLDARRVELVEAGKRQDLFPVFIFGHTNTALVLALLIVFRLAYSGTLQALFVELGSWQLGEYSPLNRFLAVPDK